MCKGADSRFFNGHTNIQSARFLVFGVKALDDVAQNLRDTMLFSILSYMSGQLLTAGNSVATIDELYLWLNNPTAITYIRNALKRVRKRESALILATQNLEDFDQARDSGDEPEPLFATPRTSFTSMQALWISNSICGISSCSPLNMRSSKMPRGESVCTAAARTATF